MGDCESDDTGFSELDPLVEEEEPTPCTEEVICYSIWIKRINAALGEASLDIGN